MDGRTLDNRGMGTTSEEPGMRPSTMTGTALCLPGMIMDANGVVTNTALPLQIITIIKTSVRINTRL